MAVSADAIRSSHAVVYRGITLVARVLVVTCATVVIHVPCDAVRPAVGLGFIGPISSLVTLLPRFVAPCVAFCIGKLLVHHRRHQSRDLGGLGIGSGEKALASSEMSDVDAVVREGGWEASSEVIPWKLADNPADPVFSAVLRRYFLDLYTKKVNSDHEDSAVWSPQSQSAMSNIPDF